MDQFLGGYTGKGKIFTPLPPEGLENFQGFVYADVQLPWTFSLFV